MTKKRYKKLFQAYASALMAGHEGAGALLKWVRRAGPGSYLSYTEAWAALAPHAARYIIVK